MVHHDTIRFHVGPFGFSLEGEPRYLEVIRPWVAHLASTESEAQNLKYRFHCSTMAGKERLTSIDPEAPMTFSWSEPQPGRVRLRLTMVSGSVNLEGDHDAVIAVDPRCLQYSVPQPVIWLGNILTVLAVSWGGLVFHAAGLAFENGAVLAIGPSGAGKTTLSRLALKANIAIFDDEQVLVLPDSDQDGRCLAYRLLPRRLDGLDRFARGPLPVRLFCRLVHSKTTEFEPAPPHDWVGVFTPEVMLPLHSPGWLQRMFDNLTHCTDNTLIGSLRFAIDPVAIRILEEIVAGR